MYDLVMAERQDEILAVGVGHRERQRVVAALAVERVERHIFQHVVHPAHVPLVEEAEAAVVARPRDHREGRGLLGDHHHRRVSLERLFVELPQEGDGLQILAAAEAVRLIVRAVVVEIEHRGHRVHADAVDVELAQPVTDI